MFGPIEEGVNSGGIKLGPKLITRRVNNIGGERGYECTSSSSQVQVQEKNINYCKEKA